MIICFFHTSIVSTSTHIITIADMLFLFCHYRGELAPLLARVKALAGRVPLDKLESEEGHNYDSLMNLSEDGDADDLSDAEEEDEEKENGRDSAYMRDANKSDSPTLSPDIATLTPAQARRSHRIMSNFRCAYIYTLSILVYTSLTSLLFQLLLLI